MPTEFEFIESLSKNRLKEVPLKPEFKSALPAIEAAHKDGMRVMLDYIKDNISASGELSLREIIETSNLTPWQKEMLTKARLASSDAKLLAVIMEAYVEGTKDAETEGESVPQPPDRGDLD